MAHNKWRKESWHTRKRPLGVPGGLSCLTTAAHCRAISEPACQGAYLPSHVLIGIRCISGQSRSLLPEPTRWFPISVRWRYEAATTRQRQERAACYPRCSRNPQQRPPQPPQFGSPSSVVSTISELVSRRPGLVVAGRLGPLATRHRRARRPVGSRCPGQVRDMRLLPFARLVIDLGRRAVDDMMQPAVP